MKRVAERIKIALEKLPLGAKRRSSLDPLESWLPYYAGYSVEFADAVLKAARLAPGSTVHDPWNGSGTTTLAATRLGLRSSGLDLNPAAILLAKARLVNRADAQGAEGFVCRIADLSSAATDRRSMRDPLRAWMGPRNVGFFRDAQQHILNELAANGRDRVLEIGDANFPPLAAFLILSLVCAAKSVANVRESANPSRIVPGGPALLRPTTSLAKIWPGVAAQMASVLPMLTESSAKASISIGDAREHRSAGEHADFVLTSPPYLTRLDYADATSFVLACLGVSRGSKEYEALRRRLMGAPLVRERGIPNTSSSWPPSVAALLDQVRYHASKDSSSYYFKTYWQYFDDARRSLQALRKCMKPGAYAAFVVQSSYYKDVRVDLPELYVALAKAEHFSATIAFESRVKTVISSIHPGTKAYRYMPDYRESVILFQRD